MADNKKRKSSNNTNPNKVQKKSHRHKVNKSSGPRLPSAFRKQLDTFINPNSQDDTDNEIIDSDGNNDLYEYEEELAQEESKKNRRFDHVDNFEYQLPDKFKDEDILSDDDDDDDDGDNGEEDEDSDDNARHARMLQHITGIPTQAFQGKKRKGDAVISEAYPESEFNPTREVLSGNDEISLEQLLDPLRGTSGYSKLRKKIQSIDKKGEAVHAPLPKPDQERVERIVAYDQTKKDITKWEQLVKRNREAPTLYFDQLGDMGLSTVGAIASDFKPRTDFEKSIASILDNKEVAEAYKSDGAKLLELNKISVEEVKDRQDRLAKMRSLLFRHEMKAKHIKKIKSKTYHRIKKKDKLKAATVDFLTDPKSARELAEKQERMRAEARMTLRHKNQGKWAKRVLERGLSKQDEGTRAAIAEQLHQHNLLTRKMNSMKDSSSSSSDDSEFDDDDECSDEEHASKLIAKAKEKTIKLMEQEDEVPHSGVATLPFMVRGLEKRKEAVNEEAKRALQEYELSLNQDLAKGLKIETPSGRQVFGATKKKVEEAKVKHRPEIDNFGSDNENSSETKDDINMEPLKGNHQEKDLDVDLEVLREGLGADDDEAIKSVIDVADDPGHRTRYDVSVFASGTWKKSQSRDKGDTSHDVNINYMSEVAKPTPRSDSSKEVEVESDTDSGGHMIDGILSSGTRQTYELPSNEELIRRAFAGDDVEDEFEKAKEDVLNEENPEPEKPLLIPGWGEWTDVQAKKGLPYWMRKEHADAKQKREAALKKRKDARLKHVIVSEKVDKKEMKLLAESLPFPYTSKEDFERVHRMPIGPEFNPASTAGALIRPEVVKKPGMIINPIKFEEVDPHERVDEQKRGQKRASNKRSGKKTTHHNRR